MVEFLYIFVSLYLLIFFLVHFCVIFTFFAPFCRIFGHFPSFLPHFLTLFPISALSPLRSLDASVSSPGNNLTYNLWTFGGLSVLIRCRIHGVVDDPSSSYKQKRMIGLGVKVHMGGHVTSHVGGIGTLDAVTEEERARWWVGTYIRPDAHMVVGTNPGHVGENENADVIK